MARRIGIFALLVAGAYCGILGWRLFRPVPLPVYRPTPTMADIQKVKSDMCALARAELRFFAATGRFASEHELRSDGNPGLPPSRRWPYEYSIRTVPDQAIHAGPDQFFIIAVAQDGNPVGLPRALILDASMEIREATAPAGLIARCESRPGGATPESLQPAVSARYRKPRR